ncbi:MAG: tRNA lysidine(34) synthetase TilS [Lachnospiraceae bacterium]|nr:tRNA lysidine(34) synthetase TilS [Lachnospiraceae bacterium]
MDFLSRIKQYTEDNALFKKEERVVLGCSGGADSVALLLILRDLGLKPATVHVNHGLREGADMDEAFVRELANRLGVPFRAERVDVRTRQEETGESLEEAARNLRYDALFRACRTFGAKTLALAHHENDQAETVLFNLVRGSGLRGLSGMAPAQIREVIYPDGKKQKIRIVRPLLGVKKEEILEFLRERGETWREDESNLDERIARNQIRLHVIPALEKVRADSAEKIAGASDWLREVDAYLSDKASEWICAHAFSNKKCSWMELPAEAFLREERVLRDYIVAEAFRRIGLPMKDKGRKHLEAVAELAGNSVGKQVMLPGEWTAVRNYTTVRLEKLSEKGAKEDDGHVEYQMSVRTFSFDGELNFPKKTYTKCFDYDKIKQRPELRTRKPGDLIAVAPGQHKKLKDWFIDEKIPVKERDRIPVVADGQDILWVLGHRMSADHKVTEETRTILEITIDIKYGR